MEADSPPVLSCWLAGANSRSSAVPSPEGTPMWVGALEPFDERGGLGRDGARLTAILARLGSERSESVAAIAQRPLQQGVHRHLAARGVRNVVKARGDLLGAPGQFAARQRFQYQRGDESIAEQGDLFGFVVVHRVLFSPGFERTAKGGGVPCKWCVGRLRRARGRGRVRRDDRREPANAASPTDVHARRRTGNGGRGSSRPIRAW